MLGDSETTRSTKGPRRCYESAISTAISANELTNPRNVVKGKETFVTPWFFLFFKLNN
ncbi:hypothetical protein AAG906_022548 [Vitis piasezkii]